MDDATRGRIIIFPIIAFALVLIDQVSKHWAIGTGDYLLNTGISFGLLKGANEIMIVIASLALILFIYLLAFKAEEFHSHAGLLLLIAGTAGNLIDRVTIGAVVDFIRVGSFPVFNVADAYLTIGVVVIIIATLIAERKAKKSNVESEKLVQRS